MDCFSWRVDNGSKANGKQWNCEQFSLFLSIFMFTVDNCLFMVCLSHENSTFSALRFVFEDTSSHRSV